MTSESQNVSEPIAANPVAGSGIDDSSILSERSVSTLMSGIIADVQRLIEQQLSMVRQEIRDDLRKSKQAASSLALGAALTAGGSVLLLLMLPLLLNGLVPTLPLWACFGVVGGVVSAVGGVLLYVRFQQTESFDLLSNPAVESFKENLKWTTKT
jgi:hypothetical protein